MALVPAQQREHSEDRDAADLLVGPGVEAITETPAHALAPEEAKIARAIAAAKLPRGSQLVEFETHVVVVGGAGADLGEHAEAAVWVVGVFLE
jgi:hypothetical protein